MYKVKILLVEDDSRLRGIIKKYTDMEGYELVEADCGEAAYEMLDVHEFQLCILDVMLPDTDGWSILRSIRKSSDIPVIMLTARSDEEDRLFGFELGTDDYMTKPFSTKELIARIKAMLKRSNVESASSRVDLGDIQINIDYREVKYKDETIDLTPIEYDLLLYFIDNKNIALSREKILDAVWGIDYYGDIRTVDTHIKRLRKKMQDQAGLIETVRGFGYKLGDKK